MMNELTIAKPLTLSSGLTLPNRLVKAAMAEHFADKNYLPGSTCLTAYDAWAQGGWGMMLTGNVQVDAAYLGDPSDMAVDKSVGEEKLLAAWKPWAAACKSNGAKAIVQINHPGRQSPLGAGTRSYFAKNIAPSPVPLYFGDGILAKAIPMILFGTPRAMTISDIRLLVEQFANTARLAAAAGFDGVEIHAAHGYLLAQFLSAKSNLRTDEYGGSAASRAKIVVDIIHAVHAAVPSGFCVAIKLNSVDHQSTTELRDCIDQLRAITAAGVDFVEISGGTYEDPTMNLGVEKQKSSRTVAREAFFLEFATSIRADFPEIPLIVTGGFRSRQGMEAAVAEGHCDLVGLGRPAVLDPFLPRDVILNPKVDDADARFTAKKIEPSWLLKKVGIRAIGAGVESTWYSDQIKKLGGKRLKAQ